jgi:hypothetical protein
MDQSTTSPEPVAFNPLPGNGTPDNPADYAAHGGQGIPTTFWQKFDAQLEEASEGVLSANPWGVGPAGRYLTQKNIVEKMGGEPVDPQVLNKEFPGVEVPFSQPTTRYVAQYLQDQAMERRHRQEIIARGPTGVLPTISGFAAGAIAHMTDPVGALLMFAGGKAMGAAVEGMGKGIAPTLLKIAGETVPYNVATEIPNIATAGAEQRNYTLDEALQNIAFSSLAGIGIGAAAHGLGAGIPKAFRFLHDVPVAQDIAEKAAISQGMQGKPVDVSPILKDRLHEIAPVRSTADMELRGPRSTAPDRPFYAAAMDSPADMSRATYAVIGKDYGPGRYTSDSLDVINGHVASKWAEMPGRIVETEIPEGAKLLHLDEPLTPELKAILAHDASGEITGKQVYDSASNPATLNQALKQAGYSGLEYQGGQIGDHAGSPHTIKMLFDESQAKAKQVLQPDPSRVGGLPKEEQEKILAERAKEAGLSTPEAQSLPEAEPKTPDAELADLQEGNKVFSQELDQAAKDGRIDPSKVEEVKGQAGAIDEEASRMEKMIRQFANCMAGRSK